MMMMMTTATVWNRISLGLARSALLGHTRPKFDWIVGRSFGAPQPRGSDGLNQDPIKSPDSSRIGADPVASDWLNIKCHLDAYFWLPSHFAVDLNKGLYTAAASSSTLPSYFIKDRFPVYSKHACLYISVYKYSISTEQYEENIQHEEVVYSNTCAKTVNARNQEMCYFGVIFKKLHVPSWFPIDLSSHQRLLGIFQARSSCIKKPRGEIFFKKATQEKEEENGKEGKKKESILNRIK